MLSDKTFYFVISSCIIIMRKIECVFTHNKKALPLGLSSGISKGTSPEIFIPENRRQGLIF
jgi:hypothetical protein